MSQQIRVFPSYVFFVPGHQVDWLNPENIAAGFNGSPAIVPGVAEQDDKSNELVMTDYGIDIPSLATIDRFRLKIKGRSFDEDGELSGEDIKLDFTMGRWNHDFDEVFDREEGSVFELDPGADLPSVNDLRRNVLYLEVEMSEDNDFEVDSIELIVDYTE